jgi:hypothetical protein
MKASHTNSLVFVLCVIMLGCSGMDAPFRSDLNPSSPTTATATLNSYRIPVSIDHSTNSENLVNHPLWIMFDTQALISNNKMNSDCSDLRILSSDAQTRLEHWLERGCNTSQTLIWVKLSSLDANSTDQIYISYGRSEDADVSNGTAVFPLFDDFEGNELDFATWTPSFINATADDPEDHYSVQNGWIQTTGHSSYFRIRTNNEVDNTSGAYAVEALVNMQQIRDNSPFNSFNFYNFTATSFDGWEWFSDEGSTAWRWHHDGSGLEVTPLPTGGNTEGMARLSFFRLSNGLYFNSTGTNPVEKTYTGVTATGPIRVSMFNTHTNNTVAVDFVFVRPFTSPEPSISLGVEEAAP